MLLSASWTLLVAGGLAAQIQASSPVQAAVRPAIASVGERLVLRGLPAISGDAVWIAAPLLEQDGMSDREGIGVQFLRIDGPGETMMLLDYSEADAASPEIPKPLRPVVAKRMEAVNARLAGAAFASLAHPDYHRPQMQSEPFRVRRAGYELAGTSARFTVKRGAKLLLDLPLPQKVGRGRWTESRRPHKSWIADIYLISAWNAVLLHHKYLGSDSDPEPIDDWSLHRLEP